MKKQIVILLTVAALLAAAAAFTGCGGGGGNNTGNTSTPAKLGGGWRVFHTPNGGAELPADTWAITPEQGNDAVITITSSSTGTTFSGTVNGTNVTITMPDGSYTVTITGTVVTVTNDMIGSTMSGTYSSTSGEIGTWRAANLAYVSPQSLKITPFDTYVLVGGSATPFAVTVTYTDGYTDDVTGSVTWSSSDSTTASVDGSGVVRGWKTGAVMITARLSPTIAESAVVYVTSGYTSAWLSGAWIVDSVADRSAGYDVFIANGSGALTYDSFYSMSTPSYTVSSSGTFTVTVPGKSGTSFDLVGIVNSSTTGSLSSVGPNSTISKVSDRSLCQGTWTGALSTGYDLAFTIKSDGTLDTAAARTIAGGSISSGILAGRENLCVGFFKTTLSSPYNAFRINGTLSTGATTTLTGQFDNDSGTAWPVGTVSLTK